MATLFGLLRDGRSVFEAIRERDILVHMDFKPAIAAKLKVMDARLFAPQLMGLANDKKSHDGTRERLRA